MNPWNNTKMYFIYNLKIFSVKSAKINFYWWCKPEMCSTFIFFVYFFSEAIQLTRTGCPRSNQQTNCFFFIFQRILMMKRWVHVKIEHWVGLWESFLCWRWLCWLDSSITRNHKEITWKGSTDQNNSIMDEIIQIGQ